MRIDRVRIKRAMRGEDGGAWAAALADPAWLAGAIVLKDEPCSSWVRRASINGRDVVVKCRLLNTPSRKLKAALGFGHGDKHWRGAAMLAVANVATARPIVLGVARMGAGTVEVLVLEYLPGRTLLDVLDAVRRGTGPSVRIQHELARCVARQLSDLLAAGLRNRDHKPSNLIVTREEDSRVSVAVIDCVGISRVWWRVDDLYALHFEHLWVEAVGCGCAPRRAIQMRAMTTVFENAARSRKAIHFVIRDWFDEMQWSLSRRGDFRPRTNPLERSFDKTNPSGR